MSKKRISLWKSESKNGNIYLSGSDKDAGIKYWVFKDKKDATVFNLLSTPLGDMDSKFTNVETLVAGTKKDGDTYHAGGDYFLGENIFYFDNEADALKGGTRYLTRKDGSTVMNAKGEPIEKNSHVLLIGG